MCILKQLKKELFSLKKILYIDLDNVVVDYQSGFKAVSNKKEKGFFENMEPVEDAVKSVKKLKKYYNVYFLSTAPWSNPYSWMEKRLWVEKYFPLIGYKKLILTHNKSLLLGDYLIDDRTKNGALDFKGELILFGSQNFPNWDICLNYLLEKAKQD